MKSSVANRCGNPHSAILNPQFAGLFSLLVLFLVPGARADDWPQWLGPQRDGVWREEGIVDNFPPGGPRQRWSAEVGTGFGGPAVTGGRVYLADRTRSGPDNLKLGSFSRNEYPTVERVLCLNQADGKPIWKHEYPCEYRIAYGTGPRCTPTVSGGKVYVLGAMGDLLCLEAEGGKVVWQKNFPRDYGSPLSMWGYACSPLIEGRMVITLAGGRGGTVAAFDKDSGAEIWKSADLSPKDVGYCSPVIRTLGGRRQVVLWHPEGLAGLEVETGKTIWSQPFAVPYGMSISTPGIDADRLCVSNQFAGAMLMRLGADQKAEVLWKANTGGQAEREWKPAGLNNVLSTVLLRGDCVFGFSTYGELCCLDAATGKRLWTTLAVSQQTIPAKTRWGSGFIVPNGGRDFIFSEKGELLIARLTREGYQEIDRAKILEPDMDSGAGRKIIWSHPAFADRCLFARNNSKIVCVELGK